jgi:hypothetical protein
VFSSVSSTCWSAVHAASSRRHPCAPSPRRSRSSGGRVGACPRGESRIFEKFFRGPHAGVPGRVSASRSAAASGGAWRNARREQDCGGALLHHASRRWRRQPSQRVRTGARTNRRDRRPCGPRLSSPEVTAPAGSTLLRRGRMAKPESVKVSGFRSRQPARLWTIPGALRFTGSTPGSRRWPTRGAMGIERRGIRKEGGAARRDRDGPGRGPLGRLAEGHLRRGGTGRSRTVDGRAAKTGSATARQCARPRGRTSERCFAHGSRLVDTPGVEAQRNDTFPRSLAAISASAR